MKPGINVRLPDGVVHDVAWTRGFGAYNDAETQCSVAFSWYRHPLQLLHATYGATTYDPPTCVLCMGAS